MGLRDRLKRLERAAGDHFTTATCPVCGETVRTPGDLALALLAAQWVREMGTKRDEDPVVSRVLDHPHEAFLLEALRDIPGVSYAN